MITILAFITMLIDHIWYIFFPMDWQGLFRIIGRLAFPLFAWGIVRWYKMTSNKEKYAKRIFILAIISQIPLIFISGNEIYNICFTLLFWLISLFVIEQKKVQVSIKLWIIALLLFIAYYFKFDYWIYGVLTIILISLFWQQKKSILYFFILTFLFYCVNFTTFTVSFSIQLYAIISFIILYFTPIQKYDFKINYYIKYWFYPLHLAILYIISLYLWK